MDRSVIDMMVIGPSLCVLWPAGKVGVMDEPGIDSSFNALWLVGTGSTPV